MRPILTIVLAGLIGGFCNAQTADEARDALKQIGQFRQQIFDEGRASGKPYTAQQIKERVDAKVAELLASVDASKVEPAAALEWARVFQAGGRHKDACDLAQKYLQTNPQEKDKFQAMYLMASSCNEQGEAEMLAMTLHDIPVPDAAASFTLINMTANVFVRTISEKQGAMAAIKTLEAVERKMIQEEPKVYAARTLKSMKEKPTAKPQTKTDEELLQDLETAGAQANENQRLLFLTKKADLLKQSGDESGAKDLLAQGLQKFNPEWPAHRRAKSLLTQMTLNSNPAPTITAERSYGEFMGLGSLKGKVVIVDFFAHWCGPCIASFPDMKQLYADLKGQGLEIVGVTRYYGYYKKENLENRDMAKDTEFAKMKEFIDEHQLPWPVVYGGQSNFEAYGVTGIPTTAVIDREGNIHKIHVGFSKDSFKKFREEIEKLIADK